MEQQGRQGIEARILVLRNVQTLLDAAVVQLQQYLSIVQMMPEITQQSPSTSAAVDER